MPAAESQIMRGNLDELEEHQDRDDRFLAFGGEDMKYLAGRMESRAEMVDQIDADAGHDRNRKHPVPQDIGQFS